MSDELLSAAALGINGNLAVQLGRELGASAITRNQGKGQDLLFSGARAEVKLLFDCTHAKYYTCVAADWAKLGDLRSEGFPGPLFLVVFFVEMPGRTYFKERREVVHGGIVEQYRVLRRKLDVEPTWPSDGPAPHALKAPEATIASVDGS